VYHSIVRRRVLTIFEEANRGNWQAMINGLHDTFTYRFVGDTPLGGERSTHKSMRAWWERLYRLFPGAQFYPQTIVVEGPPWSTTVMTYIKIKGMLPPVGMVGPEPYENEFTQLMQLRWGKITSVLTLEDTQRFARVLPRLADAGIAEATAAPITD
jgi:ketosteroid isomerase-like protein